MGQSRRSDTTTLSRLSAIAVLALVVSTALQAPAAALGPLPPGFLSPPVYVFEKQFAGILQYNAATDSSGAYRGAFSDYYVWALVQYLKFTPLGKPRSCVSIGECDYAVTIETWLDGHAEDDSTEIFPSTAPDVPPVTIESTCTYASPSTPGPTASSEVANPLPVNDAEFRYPVSWYMIPATGYTFENSPTMHLASKTGADCGDGLFIPDLAAYCVAHRLPSGVLAKLDEVSGGSLAAPVEVPTVKHFFVSFGLNAVELPCGQVQTYGALRVTINADLWFGLIAVLQPKFEPKLIDTNKYQALIHAIFVEVAASLFNGVVGDPPPLAQPAGEEVELPALPALPGQQGTVTLEVQAARLPAPARRANSHVHDTAAAGPAAAAAAGAAAAAPAAAAVLIARATVVPDGSKPLSVRLRPTQAGQALLADSHGRLEITTRVTFMPRHGKATSATQALTIPAN
ncbi:MAG TPA: hypothetical protein VME46_20445 [Acidimicrobiales bacterium]|nr:hypothetical protein [Acidimicrobiales bacterium]